MKANVGSIDRTLRVIIGIALLCLLFVLEGSARWLGLIGIIPLGTALIGYCPLEGDPLLATGIGVRPAPRPAAGGQRP